ncbi:MAG: amidohydrolase [Deltaproteobacteria bacterium]|jgi:amidohydrolase|nr:amidohydrolase [Deltaproteobacteria bacterium]
MINFKDEARKIEAEIIANRRLLHRNPELGFQEHWTTAFIKEQLVSYGIEVQPFWQQPGDTGVVGLLEGGLPGPCVALRADIDALPIEENSGCAFKSERPGVMHACGHDSHMAALLGAAKLLAAVRGSLRGKVKFIFQPAEEITNGAASMIRAGVLENPRVDFIFGLHCTPGAEAGVMLVPRGATTACVAMTSLTVSGQGGHGALPHLTKDPVLASAALIMALQSVVSREVQPGNSAVVTFGSIHGGSAPNIIPESVELKGTVRAAKSEVFHYIGEAMRRIIDHTAEALRVKTEFVFQQDVPGCFNPPQWADLLVQGAKATLAQGLPESPTQDQQGPLSKIYGAEGLLPAEAAMVGEDFACYQERVPGIFCWYGVGNRERGISASLHNPGFDLDESALPLAAAAHAQVAYDLLTGGLLAAHLENTANLIKPETGGPVPR